MSMMMMGMMMGIQTRMIRKNEVAFQFIRKMLAHLEFQSLISFTKPHQTATNKHGWQITFICSSRDNSWYRVFMI